MMRDSDLFERYGDEVQNLGLREREHSDLDRLPKEERSLFGYGEGTLRRQEMLNRLTDENGFDEEEMQN